MSTVVFRWIKENQWAQDNSGPSPNGSIRMSDSFASSTVEMEVMVSGVWFSWSPPMFRDIWTDCCHQIADVAKESGNDALLKEAETLYMEALLAWSAIEADLPKHVIRLLDAMDVAGLAGDLGSEFGQWKQVHRLGQL
jgi:hypothetical protein